MTAHMAVKEQPLREEYIACLDACSLRSVPSSEHQVLYKCTVIQQYGLSHHIRSTASVTREGCNMPTCLSTWSYEFHYDLSLSKD